MKLSVLICTVPSRLDGFLPNIVTKLTKQASAVNKKRTPDVQILYLGDNKTISVGEKRNDLLRIARGEYVVFVDDDDEISEDYIAQILNGTQTGADVINFKVMCSVNGGEYKIVDYDARFKHNKDFADHYERLPNHIMCIKRSLAMKAGFPNKSMGEDDDFAQKLRPLIRKQAFINKALYYYNFSHVISETQ